MMYGPLMYKHPMWGAFGQTRGKTMNFAGSYGNSFSGNIGQAGGTVESWKEAASSLWDKIQAGEGGAGISDLMADSMVQSAQIHAQTMANSLWKKANPYLLAITAMLGIITITYVSRRR